jgi:hypothetical protein
MSLTDTLNEQQETGEQIDTAFEARAILENWTSVTEETHQKLQEILNSGQFNLIPTDLKTVLNNWWTILKTARPAVGTNAEIMEVLNWIE